MTILTICLVLLTLAAWPFWGPILLIFMVAIGRILLALVCYPFDLVDRWKRRRQYSRRR